MDELSTDNRRHGGSVPKIRRASLDEIDYRIVRELADDARLPNSALADRVGVAPSTCLNRVRALRKAGVIRGFYADVDPAALGRSIRAMVAVRLRSGARSRMTGFGQKMAQLPEVLDVFFLGGAEDFLIHLAVGSTDELRDFVVGHLTSDAAIAHTETSVIFEHTRGQHL